jgi:hypothetical protein
MDNPMEKNDIIMFMYQYQEALKCSIFFTRDNMHVTISTKVKHTIQSILK